MDIFLTENAAAKLKDMMKDEDQTAVLYFRVSVSGGGCAGFQYHFSLDDVINADDQVMTQHDISVVIDDVSIGLIKGCHIDYVEDLVKSSFVIKNPNASTACGCGNSFSL